MLFDVGGQSSQLEINVWLFNTIYILSAKENYIF